ncbi:MAG: hypothetical protein R3Y50_02035 [Rikenellaceae bacterium]
MENSVQYITKVLEFLNENVRYALLRNYEQLPYCNSSRDIDIIIEKGELKRCKAQIKNILLSDGWKLFSYLDNGRLTTFVCAKICGNSIEMVQWDFFVNTSIHGVELLSAKEMIDSRESNGTLYHVSKDYEFLDKYTYNRAVGAKYPEKYIALRNEIKDSEIVKDRLNLLFGLDDYEKIDKCLGKRLFLRAFWSNFLKNPIKTIVNIIISMLIYFCQFLSSSIAPKIAFTGADGAGKTTIIELLRSKLSPVYGKVAIYYHFRPLLIPNLGEVAHSVKLKKSVDREFEKPHRAKKKGVVNSFFRLCYYTIDYIFGYLVKIKPHCKITKLIIFDRYYNDIIVDSRRCSIYLNKKFLYWWGIVFIPKMDYNFLITADTDIILKRKSELDREGVERINENMRFLSTKKGFYMIDNSSTAEAAVIDIFKIILEGQHQRLLTK